MYGVDLSGRVAVVTGGGRGIGRHIAAGLEGAGARVAILGRGKSALDETVGEIDGDCSAYVCDIRDPAAIENAAERVTLDLGPPDILVNNAALSPGGVPVETMPQDMWRDVLNTNLTGTFLVTQAFLPAMLERGHGDIVMIGSTSGLKGDPGWAAYAASKFGLRGFAQALFYEVRDRNVRVTVVNPSSTSTEDDIDASEGAGVRMHAADVAATVVQSCALPHRTVVQEISLWATNP